MRTISIHYTKFHPAFVSRTNLASHIMKVFQSTDNEEEMESEDLKSNESLKTNENLETNENLKPNENLKTNENLKSNEGNTNISIYKGNTDIEMNRDKPESTKQIKNVKFADQSDTAIIEMNEIPKNMELHYFSQNYNSYFKNSCLLLQSTILVSFAIKTFADNIPKRSSQVR